MQSRRPCLDWSDVHRSLQWGRANEGMLMKGCHVIWEVGDNRQISEFPV